MHTYAFSAVQPGPNIETIAETAKNEHIGEHQPENERMPPLPQRYHSDANKNIIFIPYSTHDAPLPPAFSFPADLSGMICGLDLQIYPPPSVVLVYAAAGAQLLGDMPLLPFGVPTQAYYKANMQLHPADDTREHHVFYYFWRVRQIQFLFAGPTVTLILHDLVVREPVGVVTHAICMFAALHKSQMQVVEGLEDQQAENSLYVWGVMVVLRPDVVAAARLAAVAWGLHGAGHDCGDPPGELLAVLRQRQGVAVAARGGVQLAGQLAVEHCAEHVAAVAAAQRIDAINRANDDGEQRLVCLFTWVTEFHSG